ncbi:MAG: hypothetical protein EXR62_18550 [Chloroflexi bacterium]|nr:hypothetical protein [Chloroflexota bacterium]
MTDLRLFGLPLDESGSNLSALKFLFSDGTGAKFRNAIGQAFQFANEVVYVLRIEEPSHKLELWDQAVQRKLSRIVSKAEPCFVPGTRLFLEKTETGRDVWQYGIHVFESYNRGGQRFWNLPDGVIRTPTAIIAIEFDHGPTIGNWARQLVKAIRSAASPKIEGVLFCFCVDAPKSTRPLFVGEKFTTAFQTLVEAGCNKPVGIITVDQLELSNFSKPTKEEILIFKREVYDQQK